MVFAAYSLYKICIHSYIAVGVYGKALMSPQRVLNVD